jgi:hypothetical protein
MTLAGAEYGPSPLALVARTRYQYRVFAERPVLAAVVPAGAAICVHAPGTPPASGARSSL